MRLIRDNQPPKELIDWIAQQRGAGVNLHFDTLGRVSVYGEERDVKKAILRQRLLDQGYLCAYTMVRIEEDNSHIEHLVPRSLSKAEGRPEETVEYRNMVACYPVDGTCEFGAHARKNLSLPFTPLDANCESRIQYGTNGYAKPVNPGDQNVDALIDPDGSLLRLNHSTLIRWRKNAVIGAGLSNGSKQLKRVHETKRYAREVLNFRRGDKLEPYCIALAHAADAHVKRLEKLTQKRKFSRASSK